jgi:hypothetical protein
MTDKEITHAARQICAEQAQKEDNSDGQLYLSGGWDHTVWMRLVEQGIRRGLEGHTDDNEDIRATALAFGSELMFAVVGLETQPHETNAVFEVKLRGRTRKVTVT